MLQHTLPDASLTGLPPSILVSRHRSSVLLAQRLLLLPLLTISMVQQLSLATTPGAAVRRAAGSALHRLSTAQAQHCKGRCFPASRFLYHLWPLDVWCNTNVLAPARCKHF